MQTIVHNYEHTTNELMTTLTYINIWHKPLVVLQSAQGGL